MLCQSMLRLLQQRRVGLFAAARVQLDPRRAAVTEASAAAALRNAHIATRAIAVIPAEEGAVPPVTASQYPQACVSEFQDLDGADQFGSILRQPFSRLKTPIQRMKQPLDSPGNSLSALDSLVQSLVEAIMEGCPGNMGEAMMRGFSGGVSSADRLSASVRSSERKQKMTSLGFRVFPDALKGGAEQLAAGNDIIFLGVKPIYLGGVLRELSPFLEERHLVISIAAGVKLDTLMGELPKGTRICRVMPNTPCLVGEAASTFAMGSNTTEDDRDTVMALMSSVGLAVCIDEHMMDAATALAGSGPAYVFQMLEAMSDGAVAAGLPRDKATALAAQTVMGAAKMIFGASGDGSVTHPGVLKDRVTSPGGTTITGLAELESSGVRGAYIRAIQAAAARSAEMSKLL